MPSIITYAQVEANVEVLTRETEAGDTRITEAGDTRITAEQLSNTIEGSLVANATKIPYNSITYIKVSGVWKVATLYVKHQGTWKNPDAIYKKQSGIWKRAH
ncbi:hypothetical protein UFOVP454_7 [uncultured Caudovirales phage]|uniref:Uncharacterized protein n=1 Tax=uncultured Caudovirales phage TaxID=2100421 RepID=A0A6J5MFA3_9CAUD|nr:hypothetical protein UFOVP454_7 [uncultured Caudovirales phage]